MGKGSRFRRQYNIYGGEETYTSFNVFTRDGRNVVMSSDKPLTLEEAEIKFKALAISGIDN